MLKAVLNSVDINWAVVHATLVKGPGSDFARTQDAVRRKFVGFYQTPDVQIQTDLYIGVFLGGPTSRRALRRRRAEAVLLSQTCGSLLLKSCLGV